MRRCNHCQAETDLFFCPNCGEIIGFPSFIEGNQRQEKALVDFIRSLVQFAKEKKVKISELVTKGALSEATYRRYFESLLLLQELCSKETVSKIFDANGESLIEIMRSFAQKCKLNECQIAIVGTVKAGKSMFLNAILGKEVASTYPTPETASLTKFRYSANGDYVKVTYYSKKEWDDLWQSVMQANAHSYRDDKEDFLSEYKNLNADSIKDGLLDHVEDFFKPSSFDELKVLVSKYTSCKYPEHFFAKEVEVGLSSFNVPKNVVFVDTPGLNDPVSFRSDITRRYLHSANVVLLCVKAASAEIRASELEDIAILFQELRYSKDRIYLFGTQIDVQSNYSDYWDNLTKPEFMKYLSGKSYFGSIDVAKERILPITAWYYNLIQRAKEDESLWDSGSKSRKELTRMVNECLGVLEPDDVKDGEVYKTPRQRFYESIEQLESLTFVPLINKLIMEGPIKNAENIIKQDVRDTYLGICKELIEVTQNAMSLKLDAIKLRNNKDIAERIAILDKEIKSKEQSRTKNVASINTILESLAEINNRIVHKFNR